MSKRLTSTHFFQHVVALPSHSSFPITKRTFLRNSDWVTPHESAEYTCGRPYINFVSVVVVCRHQGCHIVSPPCDTAVKFMRADAQTDRCPMYSPMKKLPRREIYACSRPVPCPTFPPTEKKLRSCEKLSPVKCKIYVCGSGRHHRCPVCFVLVKKLPVRGQSNSLDA